MFAPFAPFALRGVALAPLDLRHFAQDRGAAAVSAALGKIERGKAALISKEKVRTLSGCIQLLGNHDCNRSGKPMGHIDTFQFGDGGPCFVGR